MASMTMTKARACPDCGGVHDCAFFVEMQILCSKLDKQINRLLQDIESETHPLEDK